MYLNIYYTDSAIAYNPLLDTHLEPNTTSLVIALSKTIIATLTWLDSLKLVDTMA
jgi:hypothetical protein